MAVAKQPRQRRYEDLFDLPDDGRRYEIIDGELYEMPAPGTDLQIAQANLFLKIAPFVLARGGRILGAPLDVFFAGANPVEPDVVVLLPDRLHLISKRGIEGAPSLLVEIVSPSNPAHDRERKRVLYARGGVPEYWLVGPETASIEVLVRDGATYRTHVRATGEELVTSPLLSGLSFPASAAFV